MTTTTNVPRIHTVTDLRTGQVLRIRAVLETRDARTGRVIELRPLTR